VLTQAESSFRRWFAKVWKIRGGGFYALGIGHFVFAKYVKKHVTDWLFPDGEPALPEDA
jgi:hypothetical protein